MQKPDYFDILPNGIFLIDHDGIIIAVNKAASDILLAPADFFINKEVSDTTLKFADKSGNPILKENNPAIITLRTRNRVAKVILSYAGTEHGKKIWIECTASIRNTDHYLSDWDVLMSFTEITDLIEIEERYKAIFDQSPFILVLNDLETNKYVDVNRKFSDYTGLTKESCLGKTPLELGLIPSQQLDEMLKESIRTNSAIEQFEFSNTISGIEHTYLLWSKIIEFHQKRSGLTVVQEITDRKQMEKELSLSETKYRTLSEQLAESKEQLRALAAHLQNVREEERISIAREIHDELGHLLTVMKLDLEECKINSGSEPEKLAEKIEPMIELVNSAISSVRKISTELRPGILDHFGLIPALDWFIRDFQVHSKIKCNCFFEKESISLSNEKSSTIFRIFQEVFTNIARHSRADTVYVNIRENKGRISFIIKDNGIGFIQKKGSGKISFGLLGMKERAISIGAEFDIISAPGNGTEISLILYAD